MSDVIGYILQCDCGQKALTRQPHGPGWQCPNCSDLDDEDRRPPTGERPAASTFDIARALGDLAHRIQVAHQRATQAATPAPDDDDGYLRGMQG